MTTQKAQTSMFRDLLYSVAGHFFVIGALMASAFFVSKKAPVQLNIYQVSAVSSQSVSSLLQRAQAQEKPKPSVPQVQTTKPALPQENRKKSQAVKKTEPASPTNAVSNKPSGSTGGVQGIQTDTKFDYPEYLLTLQEKIRENWRPPALNTAVNTRVYFRIGRDGKVLQVRVEQPSGHMGFDASARNAIIACDPFPELPEEYKDNLLGVHFDFIYRID